MTTSRIDQDIADVLAALDKRKPLRQIYFVACGGSLAQMYLPEYALHRESTTLASIVLSSAEFIARAPKGLMDTSLVVLCSGSGTTPETVQAAEFAKGRGALVVGFSTDAASPLATVAHKAIPYVSQPLIASGDAVSAIILRLVFAILARIEGCRTGEALDGALAALPEVIARNIDNNEVNACASSVKRAPVIYTMASGPNYGVAYSLAICLLQEMQWIHAEAIHSGEYFHGPFEITDFDVPFILLKGIGPCRDMDDRAEVFARKFSQKVLTLDAGALDLCGISQEVAEYVTPLIFMPLARVYIARLSEERGHPLTVRRYMWKMSY